jgi:hypothetical protein
MVDLGVDIREETPGSLISRYGDCLDAVIVSGERSDIELSFRRSDGSSIPLVRSTESPDDSVVAQLAAVLRRVIESTPPVDAHQAARAVTTVDPLHGLLDPSGGLVDDAALLAGRKTDDASGDDFNFVEADARIRREYCVFLERELARTHAEYEHALSKLVDAFDEKERYIDSRLSVRVKKWIVGRLPTRES